MERTQSARLHQRAQGVFPGGVSHNIRDFEPHPVYIDRARGSKVWDVDGNEYVDFWVNHMASVLGHAHPEVVAAVSDQAANGLHYGAVNEQALRLGEKVIEYVPSAERVRFCASGTEATMYAVRVARAVTGRPHILKVAGGWHGGNTDLAAAVHAPYDEPETVGLPPGVAGSVHAFPLNDEDAVRELFDAYEVGGVIIEPMLLAGGGVEADEAFLRFLRDTCDDEGAILIFDEVVTGFRVSPGSYQARIGVTPDMTTLGKFLGGGLPVGALCGRSDLFETAHPAYDGPEPLLAGGGTFTMNPMTATAGLASFDIIESDPVYEYTEEQGAWVRAELAAVFDELGIDATVLGASSMFGPHLSPEGTLDSVEAVETQTDRAALRAFHTRLLDAGYYFLPGHMGAVSSQTTEAHLEGFIDASRTAATELLDSNRISSV